ncbi:MAG: tetratricopeptide repeat protein, partial [Bacteriovoracales bacterium]|nr:tetratricopeptide repeat protein [Bacteriovoracales bacterium]
YLQKTVFPYPLMFMYPKQIFHWPKALILGALLFLFFFIKKAKRSHPIGDYFLIFWLASFIPVSGLAYMPHFKFSFVANRYLYMGLAGLLGLLLTLLPTTIFENKLKGRFTRFKGLPLCASLFLVLSMALLSRNYGQIFVHPIAMYKRNTELNPENIYPLILLARQYHQKGQSNLARNTLERALETPNPLFFHAFTSSVEWIYSFEKERWILLAKWHERLGENKKALHLLQNGLRLHPGDPEMTEMAGRLNAPNT